MKNLNEIFFFSGVVAVKIKTNYVRKKTNKALCCFFLFKKSLLTFKDNILVSFKCYIIDDKVLKHPAVHFLNILCSISARPLPIAQTAHIGIL